MINLTDLDELVLTIKEETARSYIREAIQAFRAGAYRASVISTWIAVVFDIIAKIRYLSNQNEKSAVAFISDLDRFSKEPQSHISQLSAIERNILDTAKEQFEFLAVHEYRDLKRLQEDRHLCAHPAFITEDTLFQPIPELVRAHIVHAVTYLLQHQPVQGKSAINLILDDINKQYFPDNLEKTCDFLNARYLNRAKDSFVRNLIYELLTHVLSQNHSGQLVLKRKFLYSLIAVSKKHPATYEEFMGNKLARITENLNDEQIEFIFGLLGLDERVWRWLGQATRIRIESYISELKSKEHPSEVINRFSVVGVLNISQLKTLFLETFKDFSIRERLNIIAQTPHREFVEESLKLYGYAGSFRGAEELGASVIIPMIPYFSHEDILEILKITQRNGQIWGAAGIRGVIGHLFDSTSEYYSETRSGWQEFIDFLKKKDYLDWYSEVANKLEQKIGVIPSTT